MTGVQTCALPIYYLAGSNLLETLTMPNGMTLEQSYEAKRDLLADMDYNRGTCLLYTSRCV